MTPYLVTGGAGFIGSHIVSALVARGDTVRVLDDLSTGDRANLAHLEVGAFGSGASVELLEASITDPDVCMRACEGVAGVFHEAAQVSVPKSVEDPWTSYQVNVMGTLGLLEGARRVGVDRFVFAASSAAYGDTESLPKVEDRPGRPLSPYASGKLASEDLLGVYAHVHGMRTVALRYFNVYGPRQADDSPYTGVIALFARALLDRRQVTIHGDGEQTRDFTYVEDVVRANLLAMDADAPPGLVLNVGTGRRVTINELYACIARILESSLQARHGPERVGDVRHSQACTARARKVLGFEATTDLNTGLAATLAWYRDRSA